MTDHPETPLLIDDLERLETRLKEIPQEPGVYYMRDRTDQILYIGKSKRLRSRLRSYFNGHDTRPRIALMMRQVVEIEVIVTDTEAEALALEANLIRQHQPHFNVLLKDDKKYPYLCITWSEPYPRIFITRKRRMAKERDRYYGPYVDSRTLRTTLHLVKRIFPLRQRPQPLFKDRPCLNYDIGRCPGVCQALISSEDYRKTVQKVAMIFQGRTRELEESLMAQMEVAAENLNFEHAARLRDQIAGLKSLSAEQKVALPDDTISRDAIALAADDQHACIQLFQIRAGRLVGRLGFFADAHAEPGAILQRVLEEHYQTVDPVEIPAEILVQHELPDGEMLAEFLSQAKGRKISIVAPQRQTKAELIEMVERNAGFELARTQKFADRNTQSMQDLAEILDLPELPRRIEGYDISHIQGSDAVASQVVFIDGQPAKQHYRHYKIKNPEVRSGRSDDFASMAEVISRRFKKYATAKARGEEIVAASQTSALKSQTSALADFPDVVMIDGGKGQLSAVVKVLREMNLLEDIKVISLAKQREEIFLPGESLPLETEAEQPGVQLLRRLRDEAHRFAVSFHRQQRTTRMRRSSLDEIPGLGHHRQKLLLAEFRSIDYIREASPEQLATVPGIGMAIAKQIYQYFHPSDEGIDNIPEAEHSTNSEVAS
ncbi:excinuclease ABC subunit UvrC [Leptolyngbya boryana CZ1]|uniref:UvrABC system protein C n=2 Tax=Leptolyngbya boryana TaxID=1184 RepID=A0A1Z4JMG9_LEPBY|nr:MULTISPECIES: excinuclease ABC subunit UvrC [Leptolyngbya]MBD1854536.1 excinuclease ABC subunit UvrC [Leptolyngbya sp. FACHB-1624]MBD2367341.1 excinuclease ABC subunit UvrC [Leptolyngbya sp. FACHB-161]MBD2373865.1 excinuclease ABC subunit UvrC [Leptolyngbya sp. FACHB-238]MBD2398335.1 excinuclease ABC subunit UvrC [Leptolyngbya sp. FACHB-239]MBD2404168.1 excinuclease ABC subunit UvrC [Leptolyngbya sp. FACHB-402]BAY57896.1 UvrC protein [Leptolyngbya boryana NIES-2135]